MGTSLDEQFMRYKEYIDEHRRNVMLAYDAMEPEIVNRFPTINPRKLKSRMKEHDMSKYGPEEFPGYRQNFFPTDDETPNKEFFKEAWEHHYQTNDHHPEHWVKNGVAKEMSLYATIEMFCDWLAMSIKFNNRPSDWYNGQIEHSKLTLHTKTKKLADENIDMLDAAWKSLKKAK